jgi:ubiquinol-cytochrome c reductase cytochrome b subunit
VDTAKSIGLFAIVGGVLVLLGAFVQINPIWLYGPFHPASTTTYAQPDFTLGWVEGAIRLFPGWEATIGHSYRVPAAFWPSVFFPAATFLVLYAWPFIDKRLTRDRAEHNVLEWPRERPLRSAFGLAVLMFYSILLLAGSQDIIASQLNTTIKPVTWTLRICVVVVPPLFGAICWKLLRDLKRSHEQPEMEAPEAPNEVPARLAPSPVGPAPELLPVGTNGAHPDREESPPRRFEKVAAAFGGALTLGVSLVVEFLSRRHRHQDERKERKRGKSLERTRR